MEEVKTEKKMPLRKMTFKIEQNSYDVEFPNTGGLIEIEVLKAQLSRNQYSSLSQSGSTGLYNKFIIDMIATFTVLFPTLKKDLNVKTISELHPLETKKLLKVYLSDVLVWMNEWEEILNSDDEETVEDKKEE